MCAHACIGARMQVKYVLCYYALTCVCVSGTKIQVFLHVHEYRKKTSGIIVQELSTLKFETESFAGLG